MLSASITVAKNELVNIKDETLQKSDRYYLDLEKTEKTVSLSNIYSVTSNRDINKWDLHYLGIASTLLPNMVYGTAAFLLTAGISAVASVSIPVGVAISIPVGVATCVASPVKYMYDRLQGNIQSEYVKVKLAIEDTP